MTTAAGGERKIGPIRRFLAWISHFDVQVVLLAVVAFPLTYALPAWPGGLMSAVVTAALVLAFIGKGAHEMTWPCQRCVDRFPLNASAEAEAQAFWLREAHKYKFYIGLLVAGLAWNLGGYSLLHNVMGMSSFWSSLLTSTPMLLIVAVDSYATSKHRKLQPWCPICRRRDNGGDDEVAPIAPQPTPSGVAQ